MTGRQRKHSLMIARRIGNLGASFSPTSLSSSPITVSTSSRNALCQSGCKIMANRNVLRGEPVVKIATLAIIPTAYAASRGAKLGPLSRRVLAYEGEPRPTASRVARCSNSVKSLSSSVCRWRSIFLDLTIHSGNHINAGSAFANGPAGERLYMNVCALFATGTTGSEVPHPNRQVILPRYWSMSES